MKANFKFILNRPIIMDKAAKIKYFGIIPSFIIAASFYLLVLTKFVNSDFALFPSFMFLCLSYFMVWYRGAYSRNKFEPMISKIEAIALCVLVAPFIYFLVYAFLGYVNPPFVGPLLIIVIASFLVFTVHLADRKSKWDMKHSISK